MRDVIARVLVWALRLLLPARGRHGAALPANQPAPTLTEPPQPKPVPQHVHERNRPLDGEEVALIRPYYAAHLAALEAEQKRQRQRQREAFWATLGMDYPGVRLYGTAPA